MQIFLAITIRRFALQPCKLHNEIIRKLLSLSLSQQLTNKKEAVLHFSSLINGESVPDDRFPPGGRLLEFSRSYFRRRIVLIIFRPDRVRNR